MNKVFTFLVAISLIFSGISYAKGFKVGGFKSYKSYPAYKSQSTLKHGDEPVSKKYNTQNLKDKFNNNKTTSNYQKNTNNRPSFFSNPIFKAES
jgi:hypothetical protein